ncbi:MAG: glycosyltransferase family 2 protein [Ginsengibacter sp.]
MPLVSFCLSTYKRGTILKSTLESILRQNFQDYEVIVSDNDPEESGKEMVTGMNDQRFKYFANRQNLGMKGSFNKSLERSSGEYIVMMADDDPVYFDMLNTLVELLHTHPGYGMYMGGCDWFCTNREMGELYNLNVGSNSSLSNEHDLNFVRVYGADEFVKQFFAVKILKHYLWSTCIVKKDVLVNKGGVPEYGTPFLGDYAYLVIVASHSGCVVINRALGCQTLHRENFGRNQNDELLTLVKNFPPYVAERLKHLPSWPIIEKQMLNFLGLWMVSHLAFLYSYFKKSKKNELSDQLRIVENEVFKIDLMKKYKLRYLTKTRAPLLFTQLLLLKKKFKT